MERFFLAPETALSSGAHIEKYSFFVWEFDVLNIDRSALSLQKVKEVNMFRVRQCWA